MTAFKTLGVGFIDDPYDKALRECLPGTSPIFYCNVEVVLTKGRKKERITLKKLVLKGSVDQVNASQTQRRKLAIAYFKDQSDAKKKGNAFDLSNIELSKMEVIKIMGSGPIEK